MFELIVCCQLIFAAKHILSQADFKGLLSTKRAGEILKLPLKELCNKIQPIRKLQNAR